MTLVEFECRAHRFALPLHSVRRVLHSAQPTRLPGAPDIVLGILNVAGEVITVVDFFKRVGLPLSGIRAFQRLLVIEVSGLALGLLVDRVHGVMRLDPSTLTRVPKEIGAADYIDAVVRLEDGLSIIVSPEKFFLEEEKLSLAAALDRKRHE